MQGQPLVYGRTARVPEGQVACLARLQRAAANRFNDGCDVFARDADNADSPAARRGGDGNNGVVVSGQHGGRY
jgi:hypothetical protein